MRLPVVSIWVIQRDEVASKLKIEKYLENEDLHHAAYFHIVISTQCSGSTAQTLSTAKQKPQPF